MNTSVICRLLAVVRGGELRGQIIYGAAGSVSVKIAASATSLGVAVVLARHLGPTGYGVYSFVFALISLLAIPAQCGLPDLVVRETAKAHVKEDWAHLLGIWRWSNIVAITFSFLSIILVLIVILLIFNIKENVHLTTFFWGIALIPLIALTRLRESSLRGLRYVVQGQLSDSIVRPAVLIALVSLIIYQPSFGTLTSFYVMGIHTLAAAVSLGLSAWLLRNMRPRQLEKDVRPTYRSRQWLGSALPLAFIAGMALVNGQADLVMLGLLRTDEEVGVYRISMQGATLVSFGLSAVAMVTMPYFARFHVRSEMNRFQRLATIGARVMLAISLPVALIFVLYGHRILVQVFGPEFGAAHSPLVILSLAHVIHAGFGIVGPLLNMTGHERVAASGIAVAAASNIILNLIFIPLYGINGAALATALTYVIWNVVLWTAVRRILGIDSSVLGLISKPKVQPKTSL